MHRQIVGRITRYGRRDQHDLKLLGPRSPSHLPGDAQAVMAQDRLTIQRSWQNTRSQVWWLPSSMAGVRHVSVRGSPTGHPAGRRREDRRRTSRCLV